MIETDKFSRTGRRVIDMRGRVPRMSAWSDARGFPWGDTWPWGFVVSSRTQDLTGVIPEGEPTTEEIPTLRVYNCYVSIDGRGMYDLGKKETEGTRLQRKRYHEIDLSKMVETGSIWWVVALKVDWNRINTCPKPKGGVTGVVPDDFELVCIPESFDGEPWTGEEDDEDDSIAKQYINIGVFKKSGELVMDLIHGVTYPQIFVPYY